MSRGSANKFANEPRLNELVGVLQRKHSATLSAEKSAASVVSTMVEFIRSTATDGAFLHAFAQWCRAEQIERLEDSRIACVEIQISLSLCIYLSVCVDFICAITTVRLLLPKSKSWLNRLRPCVALRKITKQLPGRLTTMSAKCWPLSITSCNFCL